MANMGRELGKRNKTEGKLKIRFDNIYYQNSALFLFFLVDSGKEMCYNPQYINLKNPLWANKNPSQPESAKDFQGNPVKSVHTAASGLNI